MELGSKHILLGIKGALPKSKKINIRLPFYLILFILLASGDYRPQTPIYQCDFFQFLYLSFRDIQYVYNIPFDNLERGLDYFCPTKTYFLRCFHFICNHSPNPHNCCKIFPFPFLKTTFFFYLFSMIPNLLPPTPY